MTAAWKAVIRFCSSDPREDHIQTRTSEHSKNDTERGREQEQEWNRLCPANPQSPWHPGELELSHCDHGPRLHAELCDRRRSVWFRESHCLRTEKVRARRIQEKEES